MPQIKSNNRLLVRLPQDCQVVLQVPTSKRIQAPRAYSVSQLRNKTQAVACSGQLEALPTRHRLVAVFLATLNSMVSQTHQLQYNQLRSNQRNLLLLQLHNNNSLERQHLPRALEQQVEDSSELQARPRAVSLGNLSRTRSSVRHQAKRVVASLGLNQLLILLWAYRSSQQGFSAKVKINKTINNKIASANHREVSSSQRNRALWASPAMPRLLVPRSTACRHHLAWEALPSAPHQ